MSKELRSHTLKNGTVTIIQRLYYIEPGYAVWAPEKCCLFCKKCHDMFYDFTNGPYMFFCDIDNNLTDKGAIGECEYFEEDPEVEIQNDERKKVYEDYKEAMKDPETREKLDEMAQEVMRKILYGWE